VSDEPEVKWTRRVDDRVKVAMYGNLLWIIGTLATLLIAVLTTLAALEFSVIHNYPTRDEVKQAIAEAAAASHDRQDEIFREHGVIVGYVQDNKNEFAALRSQVAELQKQFDRMTREIHEKPYWTHFVERKAR